jgi:hypothetical protein
MFVGPVGPDPLIGHCLERPVLRSSGPWLFTLTPRACTCGRRSSYVRIFQIADLSRLAHSIAGGLAD